MFFALSKLLTFLIMPLSWIILILGASFLVKSIIIKKILRASSFILLLFFTNPLIVNGLLTWWEIEPVPYEVLDKRYPVGVVLTGMADLKRLPDDRLHFNQSVDRINHTIELYRKGLIEQILITGGSGSLLRQDLKEAPKLKAYAVSAGIPADKVLIEPDSKNTHENAKLSMEFLAQRKLDTEEFLLITSAFHMRRAAACFKKESAIFIPFTTGYKTRPLEWTPDEVFIPSLDAIGIWHMLIREWFGMIAYKAAGYI